MSYDSWKTDPDWGRSCAELKREDLEVSWQCAHGIHTSCRVRERGKMRPGDYSNCGCQCHAVEYCHTCKSAPCHCDDIYDAWKERQLEIE